MASAEHRRFIRTQKILQPMNPHSGQEITACRQVRHFD